MIISKLMSHESEDYLKSRVMTLIISKLMSHESEVRVALPFLLLFSVEICCL